ncbi:hypothetical protein BCU68_03280 [Vibrio sp. 10N.286.49.B3]|uniref:hypothetical protein n=1 Tax=Vibrio sp. 10N.286.49.B3 TaxID=1880855 RepID=UPI000C844453|nr:hypothetical protein [Vibrio sp. 10N.286.49.B3]PMH44537.1 hypothetical protein BCU68_03280 [Vibrio sp. 10N.286.49.B3]
MEKKVWRGRAILCLLVLIFALPALIAKVILDNQWYQSGVTNKGQLIEPTVSYHSLGMSNPREEQSWQVAYVLPSSCQQFCQQQIHLLAQSITALGQYQQRVDLVLFTREENSLYPALSSYAPPVFIDSPLFSQQVKPFESVIIDPLGQLVMRYPKVSEDILVKQSKGLLSDLRKLIKLSRVG